MPFQQPSPFETAAASYIGGGPDYEGANQNTGDAQSLLGEVGQMGQPGMNGQHVQKLSLSFDKNGVGTVDAKLSQQAAQTLVEQVQGGAQAQQSNAMLMELLAQAHRANKASDALISRLSSKLAVQDKYPIIAQLGRVAALGATAYQAPNSRGAALVRAAGAYGGEYFKESPDELQAQIAGVEEQKLRTLLPIQQAISQNRRLEIADKREQALFDLQTSAENRALVKDLYQGYEISASKGEYVPGTITAEGQSLVDRKILSKSDLATKDAALVASNKAYFAREDAAQKRESDARNAEHRFRAGLERQKYYLEKGERDAAKAVDQVAKVDEKLHAVYQAEDQARSYFDQIAEQLGKPKPTTVAEAQTLLAQFVKDPQLMGQAPAIMAQANKMIDDFDSTSKVRTLMAERTVRARRLGKEDADLASAAPKSRLQMEFFKDHGRDPSEQELGQLRRATTLDILNAAPAEQGAEGDKTNLVQKLLRAYEFSPKAKEMLASLTHRDTSKTRRTETAVKDALAKFYELLKKDMSPEAMAQRVDDYLKGD